MNALVTRGAPRDFLDIYTLCQRDLAAPEECWEIWKRKNPGLQVSQARVTVDFGLIPEPETLELLSRWEEIFDRFPLKASPAYHAFRAFFCWKPVEQLPYLGTPSYRKFDRLEEREDGFEDRV
jgi:hypothetical protein